MTNFSLLCGVSIRQEGYIPAYLFWGIGSKKTENKKGKMLFLKTWN
jgi:hypothetical protein